MYIRYVCYTNFKYYTHSYFIHKQIFSTVQFDDSIFIVMYGAVSIFRHISISREKCLLALSCPFVHLYQHGSHWMDFHGI
jgi:hypothetical protein